MRNISLLSASAVVFVGALAFGPVCAQAGSRDDIYAERDRSGPTLLERLLQRDAGDEGRQDRADSDDEMDSYGSRSGRSSDDFYDEDGGDRGGRGSRDEL